MDCNACSCLYENADDEYMCASYGKPISEVTEDECPGRRDDENDYKG